MATLSFNMDSDLFCISTCDKIMCDTYGFYMGLVGPQGIIMLQTTLSILTTGYVIRRIYRLKKVTSENTPHF